MNSISQKIAMFLLVFGVSFTAFSTFTFAAPTDTTVAVEEAIQPPVNAAAGLKASVDDPFGTGADKIKIDAARDGTLQESFLGIINYLLLFLGLLLLVIIIYAGVLIIMSDGEEDAVSKGRKMILYALVGVVIIVLSFTIVNFIADIANGGADTI